MTLTARKALVCSASTRDQPSECQMLEMALFRNPPAGMGSSHRPHQGAVDGEAKRIGWELPISFPCGRRKAIAPGWRCRGRACHRSTNRH